MLLLSPLSLLSLCSILLSLPSFRCLLLLLPFALVSHVLTCFLVFRLSITQWRQFWGSRNDIKRRFIHTSELRCIRIRIKPKTQSQNLRGFVPSLGSVWGLFLPPFSTSLESVGGIRSEPSPSLGCCSWFGESCAHKLESTHQYRLLGPRIRATNPFSS